MEIKGGCPSCPSNVGTSTDVGAALPLTARAAAWSASSCPAASSKARMVRGRTSGTSTGCTKNCPSKPPFTRASTPACTDENMPRCGSGFRTALSPSARASASTTSAWNPLTITTFSTPRERYRLTSPLRAEQRPPSGSEGRESRALAAPMREAMPAARIRTAGFMCFLLRVTALGTINNIGPIQ